MKGAFCEVYGSTIKNKVLEYLMENEDLDIAVGDMAQELEISRPKAYQIVDEFEQKEYVKKSRIIGNTQLYKLNKENKRVQLFLEGFKECLRLVVEETKRSVQQRVQIVRMHTVSAKRVKKKFSQ